MRLTPDTATPGALRRFRARARGRWQLPPAPATILFWLCAGYTTNQALAARVGRSAQTIKAQLRACRWALGATGAPHLVRLAWREYRAAHVPARSRATGRFPTRTGERRSWTPAGARAR